MSVNNKLDLLPSWDRKTPVRAAKITAIFSPVEALPFEWLLLVEVGDDTSVSIHIGVHTDWIVRHKPEVGGYLIETAGLLTYSSAAAFEAEHTPHEVKPK